MDKKQILWLMATIAALIIVPGFAIVVGVLYMCTVIARDDRSE